MGMAQIIMQRNSPPSWLLAQTAFLMCPPDALIVATRRSGWCGDRVRGATTDDRLPATGAERMARDDRREAPTVGHRLPPRRLEVKGSSAGRGSSLAPFLRCGCLRTLTVCRHLRKRATDFLLFVRACSVRARCGWTVTTRLRLENGCTGTAYMGWQDVYLGMAQIIMKRNSPPSWLLAQTAFLMCPPDALIVATRRSGWLPCRFPIQANGPSTPVLQSAQT